MKNILSLTAILTLTVTPMSQTFSPKPSKLWVTDTDAEIEVIARDGNKVYIGGRFTYIGPHNGCLGFMDTANGELLSPFPKITGRVTNIISDNKGGWFVAGEFYSEKSFKNKDLVHIMPDFSADTAWNPASSYLSNVYSLFLHENLLYVGGSFDSMGGQPRKNIACLDAATGLATDWNPEVNGFVREIFVSEDKVYVGGAFDTVNGHRRVALARLDPNTGSVDDWNPDIKTTNKRDVYIPNGSIFKNGNSVFVCGSFDSAGGLPRRNMACIDAVTGQATGWNPDANNSVNFFVYHENKLYVSGGFDSIGGQKRYYLACLDAVTGLAGEWNPNPDDAVYALVINGSKIYAGGFFRSIGGQPRTCLACLNTTDGAATPWDLGASSKVHAMAGSGNCIAVGGGFVSLGGKTRKYIACLDSETGRLTDWDPRAGGLSYNRSWGTVKAIAIDGNKVYVGGNFSTIGGQNRNGLACLDAVSGLAMAWNPDPRSSGVSGPPIYALSVTGDRVYAGGLFDTIGGKPRSNIACIDGSTGLTSDWNPGADSTVCGFSGMGNKLFVRGDFNMTGGKNRKSLACIDQTTGIVSDWYPAPDGAVYTIFAHGNLLYAGGNFSFIGGQSRKFAACLDAESGLATAWNPLAANSMIADPSPGSGGISVSGISGNNVLMEGFPFKKNINTIIVSLDANTGLASDWTSSLDGCRFLFVSTLSVSDKHLFIGGTFNDDYHISSYLPFFAQFDLDPSSLPGRHPRVSPPAGYLTFTGTAIRYSINGTASVTLTVYNTAGKKLAEFSRGIQAPGIHSVHLDKKTFPAGSYLIQLDTRSNRIVRRFTSIR